jgi:hypothetical protein
VPGLGTILTAVYGTQSFMYVAIAIGAAFCLFVGWRVLTTQAVAEATVTGYSPMTAQAPLPVELAFSPDEEPGRRNRTMS